MFSNFYFFLCLMFSNFYFFYVSDYYYTIIIVTIVIYNSCRHHHHYYFNYFLWLISYDLLNYTYLRTFLLSYSLTFILNSREHQSDWQDAKLSEELSAELIKKFNLDTSDELLSAISPKGGPVLSCGALTSMIMHFARFVR